jgi:hypothetical protein
MVPRQLSREAKLTRLAALLGYTTIYGPDKGEGGNLEALLDAIANQDVVLLRLTGEEQVNFADELARLSHRDGTGLFKRVAIAIKLIKELEK